MTPTSNKNSHIHTIQEEKTLKMESYIEAMPNSLQYPYSVHPVKSLILFTIIGIRTTNYRVIRLEHVANTSDDIDALCSCHMNGAR